MLPHGVMRTKTRGLSVHRAPIHPFPARMAPGIVSESLAQSERPLRVLDPMTGSGTVLSVARANGHRAFGFDVDPLAVLLARVWTTATSFDAVRQEGVKVLRSAEKRYPQLDVRSSYPRHADAETRAFLAYWFDAGARRQLTALAEAIGRVEDTSVRELLWCCFSRLIITKQAGASRAMDLSHSRPHRAFLRAPVLPLSKFQESVDQVVSRCIDRASLGRGPATVVRQGDARSLPLPSASIDLIVTSPPYLNAIDYMRCSKFSLVWMGYQVDELRRVRGQSVGTEVGLSPEVATNTVKSIVGNLGVAEKLPPRNEAMLARYVQDMLDAVAEASRVLVPGGKAVYVVGDNTIRGCFIENSAIVAAAGERVGLTVSSRTVRALPANRRYLPPPRERRRGAALDTRMSQEVVLTFGKSS